MTTTVKPCSTCGALIEFVDKRTPFAIPPHLVERFEALEGDKKHYCPDWDYLPIDENCQEFEFCSCFDEERVAAPGVK